MNNKASSNTNSINIQGASPKSWHIPSDAEWQELIEYLGGEAVAEGKSKEIGFTNWLEPIRKLINYFSFSRIIIYSAESLKSSTTTFFAISISLT